MRVLPLPDRKYLPRIVSFSPTFSFIGLIDLMTGSGIFAAEAGALATSRALESAPRQRTTRREFIDPVFGRRSRELERTWTSGRGRGISPGVEPRAGRRACPGS